MQSRLGLLDREGSPVRVVLIIDTRNQPVDKAKMHVDPHRSTRLPLQFAMDHPAGMDPIFAFQILQLGIFDLLKEIEKRIEPFLESLAPFPDAHKRSHRRIARTVEDEVVRQIGLDLRQHLAVQLVERLHPLLRDRNNVDRYQLQRDSILRRGQPAPSGTLTFEPGETVKVIPLMILQDTLVEPTELIQITLSTPTNAVLGNTLTHVFSILDDDRPI